MSVKYESGHLVLERSYAQALIFSVQLVFILIPFPSIPMKLKIDEYSIE